MWALTNETPYQVDRTWVRDKEGAHHWVVAVKATFDVNPNGSLSLSAMPVAPLHTPEYIGKVGESSLRYEADLIAMKPGTDVYLNGIAHAPKGQRCTKANVSIRVDRIQKELIVYGERTWERTAFGGIAPSSPKPFETMPIIYERAFGGFDQRDPDPKNQRVDLRNPVGTGIALNTRDVVGQPAIVVEDPKRKPGDGAPAGFGAVASFWSPRRELMGTYDDQWKAERFPLLPLDYDPNCLLCSPLDQRGPGYLKGGEPVELTNLTPSGHLRFVLPNESLHFETHFGLTRKEHGSELVSVIIESEGPRLILVWQTSLRCGNDADYLDRTVIRQNGRMQ